MNTIYILYSIISVHFPIQAPVLFSFCHLYFKIVFFNNRPNPTILPLPLQQFFTQLAEMALTLEFRRSHTFTEPLMSVQDLVPPSAESTPAVQLTRFSLRTSIILSSGSWVFYTPRFLLARKTSGKAEVITPATDEAKNLVSGSMKDSLFPAITTSNSAFQSKLYSAIICSWFPPKRRFHKVPETWGTCHAA